MKTQTNQTQTNRTHNGTPAKVASILAFTGLALAGLASGCGHQAPVSAGRERHIYVGLDTSGSWRPYLGVSATLCTRQAMLLDPGRDKLTLYRLDSSTREFSNGPAPESGDRLQRTIVHEVASVSGSQGTFPARFWTAAAGRAAGDPGSVTVEIYSDGDNDDQTAQSVLAIQAAAQRLAANPHVTGVWVFGAEPRNWAALRAEFAPLGDRLHLYSPTEMTGERAAAAVEE